jgi:hypothetical protein
MLAKFHFDDSNKENEMVGNVACRGERRMQKVEVGKSEGKRPFGRSICRWDDSIKMDLRHMKWVGVDCICLDQDRK